MLSGGTPAELTPTAAVTAARWGIGILETVGDVDLAELSVAIARELSGGADVALVRAHAALRADPGASAGRAPEGLLERAGAALGVPLALLSRLRSLRTGPRRPSRSRTTSRAG